MADSQRKTANLFDGTLLGGYFTNADFNTSGDESVYKSIKVYLTAGTYTFSWGKNVNSVRLIVDGNYSQPAYTNISTQTIISTTDGYVGISFRDTTSSSTVWDNTIPIMLNSGSQPLPYEPYGWVHSLRKFGTATDTITTLPADLYADGTNATVGLKGNMSQTGTPTPSSPIQPQECGERTAQIWDISSWDGATAQRGTLERVTNGYKLTATSGDAYTMTYGSGAYSYGVVGGSEYTLSWTIDNPQIYGVVYIFTGASVADTPLTTAVASSGLKTFTVPSGHNYVAFRLGVSNIGDEITYTNIMLNTGSTALPSQPYGYKLTISSASTTTPVYLGEVESTRKIKKLVLDGTENISINAKSDDLEIVQVIVPLSDSGTTTASNVISTHFVTKESVSQTLTSEGVAMRATGAAIMIGISFSTAGISTSDSFAQAKTKVASYLAAQYAAGTPVCVWYVLATPETAVVNEPIRKIGDYADTVSGITIPTITGKDTFDVQTTLKPSEVELTYTGWHDATVKEWDGSQWQ